MGWIILIVILLVIVLGVRIVPQSTAKVIERLGSYHTTMQTGVHYVIPFIDRVANDVTLKEIVKDLHLNQLLRKIMLLCKLIRLFIFKLQIQNYILMELKIQ